MNTILFLMLFYSVSLDEDLEFNKFFYQIEKSTRMEYEEER